MQSQHVSIPGIPRLSYSIAETEALSGLSRASLYRLIAAGKLQSIQRGRRRLIPSRAVHQLCGDTSP